MKVGVVVFPGSNCDRDMYHVLTDVFHLDTEYLWHEKGLPENIDAVTEFKCASEPLSIISCHCAIVKYIIINMTLNS